MRGTILIVTQCFHPTLGGIEAVMTNLADHLAARGYQVHVFAEGRGEDDGGKPYVIRRFSGPRPWRRWRKRAAVARVLRAGTASAIFADSWKSVRAIPTASPIAVLAHGAEFPTAPAPAKRSRLIAALARADVVIANSAFTAAQAQAYLSDEGARVRIVHPPIERQPQPEAAATANIKTLIGREGPVLTTLARLEPRKGVDMVLCALPGLSLRYPGLTYVVAGAGPDEGRLKALAARLGVESRVRFIGAIDNGSRAALLSLTDVFAMPTRREGQSVEGFGLVYIEAAWYGAPSVAGWDGGGASAVLDGETGLLCDGADAASVEDALARLLEDPDLRARLGAAAARRARVFTWDLRVSDYLAALAIPSASPTKDC